MEAFFIVFLNCPTSGDLAKHQVTRREEDSEFEWIA